MIGQNRIGILKKIGTVIIYTIHQCSVNRGGSDFGGLTIARCSDKVLKTEYVKVFRVWDAAMALSLLSK